MPNDMKRMNYFNGLLLKEEDLQLDQSYHQRLQRLHNRYFHGWGIVTGLDVIKTIEQTKVEVTPGLAVNRVLDAENNEEIGQEIVVSDNHPERIIDLSSFSTSDQIYITVSYKEKEADTDLTKGGEKKIHMWEVAEIKAGSKKPEDKQKELLLARVTLKHNQDGTLAVEGIYKKDVDGTALVTSAVGGSTLNAGKLIIGSKDDPSFPYLSNSEQDTGTEGEEVEEGTTLYVHAPVTEFTGAVRSGALTASGAVEVDGSLAVISGGEQTLKVSTSGDIELSGPVTVSGPLSAAGGLDVSGGLATLDVPQVIISGNMVTLGKNAGQYTSSGIEISREDQPNAKLIWDEEDKVWKIGTENRADQADSGMHTVAYGADWEKLHHGKSADGLHTHSGLHDGEGKPSLTTDKDGNILVENALTVNGKLIAKNGSLEVPRGETLPSALLAWNETAKSWQMGTAGGEMTDIPDGKRWEELTGGNSNADALHTHRQFHNEDQTLLALEIGADGNVNIPHELMVGETLTVNKLIVREEEVLVRKVEQELADSFLTVNKGENDAAVDSKGGLEVYRGSGSANARLEWNESDRKWKIGISGSMSDIPYGSKWDALTNGTVADASHKHSQLSTPSGGAVLVVNDQGKVTASGNAEIGGTLLSKGDAELQGNLKVAGSATIAGNLTVTGTTTVINKSELAVTSNRIELNKFEGNSSAIKQSSIEVYRGKQNPSAKLVWDENTLRWKLGLGDDLSNIAYGTNWDALTGGVSSDADGLHRHNSLSDSSGNTAVQTNADGGIEIVNDAEIGGTLTVNNGVDIAGGLAVEGTLTVDGNLLVKGTTTTVSREDLVIESNMIEINKFEGDLPVGFESGVEVYRGESQPGAKIVWSESERKWMVGIGSSLESIASGSSWDKLTQMTSADSLHIHSQIYNPQTDVLALSASAEGDIDVHHDLTVGGGATVAGSLEVRGDKAIISTGELTAASPVITLNKDGSAAASAKGGSVEIYRGTADPAARISWDEEKDQWKLGLTGAAAGMTVDTAGSVEATGGIKAASAAIAGAVSAASAVITGALSVGEGLEVPQGTESSAQIKWVKDRWKLGTTGKTVLSLTRSGKMGVGTDNPTEALDVAGKAVFRTEAEIAGAASISGKLTAHKEAVFEDAVTFSKAISAADVAVSGDLEVAGSLVTDGLEAPRGLSASGGALPNARIFWDNAKEAWYYGNGVTQSELGTSKSSQNKLYNSLGDAIAVFADTEGKVGVGTSTPLAPLDVRVTADATALSVSKAGNVGIGTLNPKAKLDVQGDAAITGTLSAASAVISKDLTVTGNLTVNGDVVTINTATLEVEDNIVRVNKYDPQPTPVAKNGGLEVFRGGTAPAAQLIWDENADQWLAGPSDALKALEFKGHTHPEYAGVSDVLKIDSGNVGIGTDKPSAKLDVAGNAVVSGKLAAAEVSVGGQIGGKDAAFTGTVTTKDATLTGKLTAAEAAVTGTLTAKDVTASGTMTAKDAVISGSLTAAQGLSVARGSDPKAQIVWDETTDEWQLGVAGSMKQLSYSGHTHQELTDLSGTLKVVSGNVGIGVASPSAKLDVAGNAAVSGKLTAAEAAVSGQLSGKDAAFTGTVTAKDATLTGKLTAAEAAVTGTLTGKDVTASGTLTAKDAVISGSLTAAQGLGVARGSDPKAQILWDETTDEWQLGVAGSMKQLSYSGHTHQELTDLSGALKVVSGNVGIGVASPSAKLDVAGNAAVSGKLTAAEAAVTGTLSGKDAAFTGTVTAKDATLTGKLTTAEAAVTGALTVKDITASGTLTGKDATLSGTFTVKDAGVTGALTVKNAAVSGTLTAAEAAVSSKLTVKDAAVTGILTVGQGLTVDRGTASAAKLLWDDSLAAWTAGTAGDMKELSYSGHAHEELTALSGAMAVDDDGNVGIGKTAADGYKLDVEGNVRAANFAQTSSRTFKENISALPFRKALELLNKLKPVTFSYKAENGKSQNIGFIAEEVPTIFSTSDQKSVVLMDIIAVLTTVVQKQHKDAAEMQKQFKALQAQVAALAGA